MEFDILIRGLTLTGIYFLISYGITLLYGVGGFPSLVVGPIGLTGAYVTCTLLRSKNPIVLSVLVGIGISVFLGTVIQKLVVEPLYNSVGGGERGRIFVIYGTFGLVLLFPAILLNVFRVTMTIVPFPRLPVIKLINSSITTYELLSITCSVVLFVGSHFFFTKTRLGTNVRAVTQNPLLAQLIRINVSRIYLVTAAAGGAFAYFGAILWGTIFSLDLESGMTFTLYGFMIAVMGGLGSVYGSFIVSMILGFVMSATSFLIGGVFEHIVTMVVLMLLLVTKPMGIIPTRRDI